jgi:bifunctional non-homologous end joining protein LigD
MWREDPAGVRPMLATTGSAPLDSAEFAYEPKYDGIRALASVIPTRQGADVRFWSRLGNDKTAQFPEIADALERWGRSLDRPVLVDGELVALDESGDPLGFQHLQRLHMTAGNASRHPRVAYFLFDILRDGTDDVRALSLRERRTRLVTRLGSMKDARLRISEQSVGHGGEMHARAQAGGWEGVIAKKIESPYSSGKRSPEWKKLKLVRRQACVIGGWTDPRGSRPFFGALLLGVHDNEGRLQYIGHTGAGFTDAELGRVWRKLRGFAARRSPFAQTPKTNAPPHWVEPKLVAEVKFTEWTADGKLRHPTYIGLRDDIKPATVRKEPDTIVKEAKHVAQALSGSRAGPARSAPRTAADQKRPPTLGKAASARLLDQLDAIQEGSGSGVLELPGGDWLEVTNLRKVFWPKEKLTKGDLFRHYVRVAPYILPVLADRPLVMKRYPSGVDGKPFYQHRAPEKVPPGVRVEQATSQTETRAHIIGGNLVTLLYTAQLAAISQDPWFSRVQSEDAVDHVAIDLDPPDGLPFARVLDVARWVRDELEAMKAPSVAKTSGAGGLHIHVPMPPGTSYEAGLLFCQIVATVVTKKHPKLATVERSLKARGRRIYVDYMQNSRGKTLASAYSARASEFAGMSAPVTWKEVEDGRVTPRDFTLRTAADRLEAVGDLWAPMRRSRGADLRAVMQYAEA